MPIYDFLKINQKIPEDSDIDENKLNFWEESYSVNSCYIDGKDSKGNPIIVRFDCESNEDYKKRKRITNPRNYSGFILNKYNSSIFLNEPIRSQNIPEYLLKSADGLGTPFNQFFSEILLDSQIFGESYVLLDINPADNNWYFNKLDIDDVLTVEANNKTIEALIELEDMDGNEYYRYYNKTQYCDILINDNDMITAISPLQPHGFSQIPLSICHPHLSNESQISNIAESQRQIANYLSLLNQEIVDSTFTKFIASGVRLPDSSPENASRDSITFSGKRLILFEDPGVTLQKVGADVTQADSISKRIQEEEQNIFRTNGLSNYSWDNSGQIQQMSGISRKLSLTDFFSTCNKLKSAIENCENYLLSLVAEIDGIDIIPSVYSSNYIANDYGEDITDLRDLLNLNLPSVIKNRAILAFVERYYNVSEQEKNQIINELNQTIVGVA